MNDDQKRASRAEPSAINNPLTIVDRAIVLHSQIVTSVPAYSSDPLLRQNVDALLHFVTETALESFEGLPMVAFHVLMEAEAAARSSEKLYRNGYWRRSGVDLSEEYCVGRADEYASEANACRVAMRAAVLYRPLIKAPEAAKPAERSAAE